MNSIRRRLTIFLTLVTTLLAVATGIGLYAYVYSTLVKQFDANLSERAHMLTSLLRIEKDGSLGMDFSDESMPEYQPVRKPEYFEGFLPNGRALERSLSLRGGNLIDPAKIDAIGRPFDMPLPDGRTGRALVLNVKPRPDTEDRDEARLPGPLPTVVANAPIITVVTSQLLPIDRVAARAAAIGPDTLTYRFEVDPLPLELKPICTRLNDLLQRLEEAFKRERKLNADIAHELRTPISELRTLTEVATRWPCTTQEATRHFTDAHRISLRMGLLIETLLGLARNQSQHAQFSPEPVELDALLREIAARLEHEVRRRRLDLKIEVPEDQIVQTGKVMLQHMLENVISNAITYATTAGRIICTSQLTPQGCVVTIGNDNDSLTENDLKTMFDAFWRKDASRTGDSHAGLGLSLVSDYARHLDVEVKAQLPTPDWFEISFLIPARSSDSATNALSEPITSLSK